MPLFRKNRSSRTRCQRRRHSRNGNFRPELEGLEDRLTPSTLVVSTTADSGPGSLRQAITQSNSDTAMTDTITFTVTGAIQLASALPALTNSVNIDGPGSGALTIEPANGVHIRILMIDSGVTANISGLTLANANLQVGATVTAQGGAINNAGTLNITSCVLNRNLVTGGQGLFAASPTQGQGGGIYNAGTLFVMDCTLSNNDATGGAGSSFTGGAQSGAEGAGGGIYSSGGSVTIVASTLSGNFAIGGSSGGVTAAPLAGFGGLGAGGGLFLTNGAQAAIYSSALLGNQAFGGGGGDSSGTNRAGNGGDASGGAIFVDRGALSITSGTIAANSSVSGFQGSGGSPPAVVGTPQGGGIDNGGGSVAIADTLVANNFANTRTNLVNNDVQGLIQSNGYNLIRTPTGGTFTGKTNTDLYNVDPLLNPTSDALEVDSVAVDAGDPNYVASGFTAADVRGLPRIVNRRVDIGAYEVQANELRLQSGSTIAAANPSVVFAVTATNGLAVHQNGAWTPIGGAGTIATISAVTDIHGNATVFAVTTNYALAEWSQASRWQSIGGTDTIKLGTAGLDANGLPDIYVVTTNGFTTGWSTSGGWIGSLIGGATTMLSLSAANAGNLYAVWTSHTVYQFNTQTGW